MRFWFKKGAWASKRGRETLAGLQAEDLRSIAVIRHSALGDMMLTRPFLVEARKAFPKAKITLSVLESYTRGLPEDLVDRVHTVYNKKDAALSLNAKINNLRELGDHDIIFDLADTSRSLLLCNLNKARLKIGFPYRSVYRRLVYDAAIFRSEFVFEAELLLHMLNLIGIKTAYPPDFGIAPPPPQSAPPYLVYFAGASTQAKCWPLKNFNGLIRDLSQAYPNYDHLVLKGIGDWESFSEILEGLDGKSNIKSIEIENLDETLSFIQGATMVISNDTGIRHLAIASAVPTLGIFFGPGKGSTQPYRYWPRYGLHDIVYALDGSPPSVARVLEGATNLMEAIQASDKHIEG